MVAGCTCNGKDQLGLAPVKIEDDPTLRKGDIVAGEDGLMVAGRGADKRGASLNFSPASDRVRARFERVPVVARNKHAVIRDRIATTSTRHPVPGTIELRRLEPIERRARSVALI